MLQVFAEVDDKYEYYDLFKEEDTKNAL